MQDKIHDLAMAYLASIAPSDPNFDISTLKYEYEIFVAGANAMLDFIKSQKRTVAVIGANALPTNEDLISKIVACVEQKTGEKIVLVSGNNGFGHSYPVNPDSVKVVIDDFKKEQNKLIKSITKSVSRIKVKGNHKRPYKYHK